MTSRIADPASAPSGHQRIDWARRRSPVLDGFVRAQLGDRLRGVRVAVVVHLEAKTAFLATVLADAGAHVVAAGSNPWTTRDDVAAALVERGVEVHSSRRSTMEVWEHDLAAVAATGPEYVIDDGAELTVRIARDQPERFAALRGVSEETTTGVARLRGLDDLGRLPFPVIAANDAACKHMFDNRYGTGQSTIDGIIRATNVLIAGRTVVIAGYGWCGRGVAMRAKGHGAHVIVTEVDAMKALEAVMDGFQVMSMAKAAEVGDIFVTATGDKHVIARHHMDRLKDGAILANTGHFNVEIDIPALRSLATETREARTFVEEFTFADGRKVFLLAEGRLVNLAAAEGHPAQVMDMSFANQALAAEYVIENAATLEPKVYDVPTEIDDEIARLKLATMGVTIDELTEEQASYLASWDEGT